MYRQFRYLQHIECLLPNALSNRFIFTSCLLSFYMSYTFERAREVETVLWNYLPKSAKEAARRRAEADVDASADCK